MSFYFISFKCCKSIGKQLWLLAGVWSSRQFNIYNTTSLCSLNILRIKKTNIIDHCNMQVGFPVMQTQVNMIYTISFCPKCTKLSTVNCSNYLWFSIIVSNCNIKWDWEINRGAILHILQRCHFNHLGWF